MEGFIKLYRQMTEWEWYKDNNTKSVFLHLLLTANIKDIRYMGAVVPRGSVAVKVESTKGEKNLCHDLGLTPREVRTALNHLESSGEITRKTTNKNTLITIVNYEVFQGSEKQNDNQTTIKRQTNDKLTTSIEEERKEREEEKEINNDESELSPVDALFDSVWKLYPNKQGKNAVSAKAKKELLKQGYDIIAKCIDAYGKEKPEWQNYMNGSTFFNGRWQEFIESREDKQSTEQIQAQGRTIW